MMNEWLVPLLLSATDDGIQRDEKSKDEMYEKVEGSE